MDLTLTLTSRSINTKVSSAQEDIPIPIPANMNTICQTVLERRLKENTTNSYGRKEFEGEQELDIAEK